MAQLTRQLSCEPSTMMEFEEEDNGRQASSAPWSDRTSSLDCDSVFGASAFSQDNGRQASSARSSSSHNDLLFGAANSFSQVLDHAQIKASFGIDISGLGPDTVVLFSATDSCIVINAHLKEFKKSKSQPFLAQMRIIQALFRVFGDYDVYLLADANTQFSQNGPDTAENRLASSSPPTSLWIYDKEGRDGQQFSFEMPVLVNRDSPPDRVPDITTTEKMRGTHTAQQNKSFVNSKCFIDHVLFKPARFAAPANVFAFLGETKVYVLGDDNKLALKQPHALTTSPRAISDHAIVVETCLFGVDAKLTLASFNIKGGAEDDAAWAEFVPSRFAAFFQSPALRQHLDDLLIRAAFSPSCSWEGLETSKDNRGGRLADLKSSNYFSLHRFSVMELHMPNHLAPYVSVDDQSKTISVHFFNLAVSAAGADDAEQQKEDEFMCNGRRSFSLVFKININIEANDDVLIPDADFEVREERLAQGDWGWIQRFMHVLREDLNFGGPEMGTRRKYFVERVSRLLNYYALVQNDEREFESGTCLKNVYAEWFQEASTPKVSIAETVRMLRELHPDLKFLGLQEFPKRPQHVVDALEAELGAMGRLYMMPSSSTLTELTAPTRGAILEFF